MGVTYISNHDIEVVIHSKFEMTKVVLNDLLTKTGDVKAIMVTVNELSLNILEKFKPAKATQSAITW